VEILITALLAIYVAGAATAVWGFWVMLDLEKDEP
jgi:hypothetical protein